MVEIPCRDCAGGGRSCWGTPIFIPGDGVNPLQGLCGRGLFGFGGRRYRVQAMVEIPCRDRPQGLVLDCQRRCFLRAVAPGVLGRRSGAGCRRVDGTRPPRTGPEGAGYPAAGVADAERRRPRIGVAHRPRTTQNAPSQKKNSRFIPLFGGFVTLWVEVGCRAGWSRASLLRSGQLSLWQEMQTAEFLRRNALRLGRRGPFTATLPPADLHQCLDHVLRTLPVENSPSQSSPAPEPARVELQNRRPEACN
jgi:hypothetical protein